MKTIKKYFLKKEMSRKEFWIGFAALVLLVPVMICIAVAYLYLDVYVLEGVDFLSNFDMPVFITLGLGSWVAFFLGLMFIMAKRLKDLNVSRFVLLTYPLYLIAPYHLIQLEGLNNVFFGVHFLINIGLFLYCGFFPSKQKQDNQNTET